MADDTSPADEGRLTVALPAVGTEDSDGDLITACILITAYITPDGERRYGVVCDEHNDPAAHLGLLELAQSIITHRALGGPED